jgi:plastocyanin
LVVLLALTGCRKTPVAAAPKPQVPPGKGSIAGIVKFEGVAPAPKPIVESTPSSCHAGAAPILDDSLLVSADGGLKNVVVYIDNGPNIATTQPAAVLDQKNCQYTPHVLAVKTGETVTVRSSDPTIHNVHAATSVNPPFNLSFTGVGQENRLTFADPESFTVRCDVHPWMRAYIKVFDHPLFAVTGEDGRFELKGLPPGTYTLVAWHEKLGEKRQQITVADDEKSAEFRFGK